MRNVFSSIVTYFKPKRGYEDQKEREKKLLERIKKLQEVFPITRKTLNDSKDYMVIAVKKSESKDENTALVEVENLINDIESIEKELAELQEILRMNEEIKKYLFTPIRKSQNVSILVTVLFGIIGLLLTGPEIYGIIKQTFFTNQSLAPPEYYATLRLDNIRKNLNDELYKEADKNAQDLINEPLDDKIKAQAQIYQSLVGVLTNPQDYGRLSKEIGLIPVLDDFLEGQKILLTSIFHYKNNEFEDAKSFLRKITNEEKFIGFHYEATYYRFLISLDEIDSKTISGENVTETDFLKESKSFLDDLESSDFDSKFLDMTSGKTYDKQGVINISRVFYTQKDKLVQDQLNLANLHKKLKSLKIAIRYNVNKLNGQQIPNERVVTRTETFHDFIKQKYPDISINFGPISNEEIEKGGYKDDNVYWKNNIAELFLKNELIKKHDNDRLKNYVFERNLGIRYGNYDMVFIISNP